MAFSLKNSLEFLIDKGADFLMGEEVMTSDMARRGESPKRSDAGGFLGLVKAGAEVYTGMMDAEDKDTFADTEFEAPKIKRYSGRAPTARQAADVSRLGFRNAELQNAFRRTLQRVNTDRNLQRMTAQYTVRPTKSIQKQKPVSPGTTTIKRKIPVAKV